VEVTDLDLDAIRARYDVANPGPWTVVPAPMPGEYVIQDGPEVVATTHGLYAAEANAEFIAHARVDVPALLAEVERLRTRIHEAVDETQRRYAKYQRRCDEFDLWSNWARETLERAGDTTTWTHTSEAHRLLVLSLKQENERLRAQHAAALALCDEWAGYGAIPTQDIAAMRRALGVPDATPTTAGGETS